MRKILYYFFLLWIGLGCGLAEAAPSAKLQGIPKTSEVNITSQPDNALIEKYQLIVENQNKQLENQDRRLNDIWGAINILGYIAALLGVLTTAIVVFFSFKASTTAVAEARIEAGKSISEWLTINAEKLLLEETNKAIGPQLERALREIKEAATPILVALDTELQKTVRLNVDFEAKNSSKNTLEAEDKLQDEQVEDQGKNHTLATNHQYSLTRGRLLKHPDKPALREAAKLAFEDRYAEAIAIIEEITERLANATDENDQVLFIEAQNQRIDIIDKLDGPQKALPEYEKLESKFTPATSPNKAMALINVLYDKALAEIELDKFEDAINTCDKVISLHDQFSFTGRWELLKLVRVLNVKSKCLFNLGRYQLVIDLYDNFPKRIPDVSSLGTMADFPISNFRINYIRSLIALGKRDEAKNILKSAIKDYSESNDDRRIVHSWRLKLLLSSIFEDEDNIREAMQECTEIIQDFHQKKIKVAPTYVMQALLKKASILSKLTLSQEELHVYDEIIDMCTKIKAEGRVAYTAYEVTALVNKAITLSKLGQSSQALEIVHKVLQEFHAADDEEVVEQTVKAARLKAVLER